MKNFNFKYLVILVVLLAGCVTQQSTPNIQATSKEVADNLDLEAVAAVFGEARNLEDFERMLNDEKEHLSNLDLNNDGYTDYLRVIESVEGFTHVVTIQAALGNNLFQDIATIDVEKNQYDRHNVQVIGNPYYYGNNYIIEPFYYHNPYIFDVFWTPNYRPWRSPFYWSYYPSYYRPWRPWPVHTYVNHVVVIRNPKNTFRYTKVRRSTNAVNIEKQHSRDDFSRTKPNDSFNSRNRTAENKAVLDKKTGYTSRGQRNDNATKKSDARAKPSTGNARNANPQENRTSKEGTRPKENARTNSKPTGTKRGDGNSGAPSTTKKTTRRGNN